MPTRPCQRNDHGPEAVVPLAQLGTTGGTTGATGTAQKSRVPDKPERATIIGMEAAATFDPVERPTSRAAVGQPLSREQWILSLPQAQAALGGIGLTMVYKLIDSGSIQRVKTLLDHEDLSGLHRLLTGLDRDSIEMREVTPMSRLLPEEQLIQVLREIS